MLKYFQKNVYLLVIVILLFEIVLRSMRGRCLFAIASIGLQNFKNYGYRSVLYFPITNVVYLLVYFPS